METIYIYIYFQMGKLYKKIYENTLCPDHLLPHRVAQPYEMTDGTIVWN